jgi:hypothetical protein
MMDRRSVRGHFEVAVKQQSRLVSTPVDAAAVGGEMRLGARARAGEGVALQLGAWSLPANDRPTASLSLPSANPLPDTRPKLTLS